MESHDLEIISGDRDAFRARVELALADVLNTYRGKGNLLRPKINSCLESKFGIRSREIDLRIPEGSQGFSLRFSHPVHGEMTLEA